MDGPDRPGRHRGALRLGALLVLAVAGIGIAVWLATDVAWWIHRAGGLAERAGLVGVLDRIHLDRTLEAAGLTDPSAGAPVDPRPDVLVIVLDTLRRDRLALYGRAEDPMPRLSRWAERARVYTEARSTSSWTLPSHASLFTGLYPLEHGAHGIPFDPANPVAIDAAALPAGIPTLAEAFRDAGYATVGIAANRAYLSRAMGLQRGFDAWLCEDLPGRRAYPPADRITALALRTLETLRRPRFVFLNYMDPHQPIHVRERYTPDADRIDERLLPHNEAWYEPTRALMEDGVPLPPAVVESWSLGYDGELRFMDEHLARLLDGARAFGIDDDDLVVVLSDHGESFGSGSQRIIEHSKHLYEQLVRIPLLVRGPGFAPGRDPTPVQTQDVPGWVLSAAGLDPLPGSTPTGGLQVTELYWTRHKDLRSPRLRERFDRVLRGFVDDSHAYFADDRGREELYELRDDPHQEHPLEEAPWRDRMRQHARDWLRDRTQREGRTAEGEDADEAALRALGYVE